MSAGKNPEQRSFSDVCHSFPPSLPPQKVPILCFLFVAVHTCVYCVVFVVVFLLLWDYGGKRLRRIFLTRANYRLDGSQRFSPIPHIFPPLVCGRRPRLGSLCQRAVVSGNSVSPPPVQQSAL